MGTVHAQLEIEGPQGTVSVDEGLSYFLQLVWARGMTTAGSCQGGGGTADTQVAYILFPDMKDAAEFLITCAHLTEYRLGDNIALTIMHPPETEEDVVLGPQGKVTWMPEFTLLLSNAWSKAT